MVDGFLHDFSKYRIYFWRAYYGILDRQRMEMAFLGNSCSVILTN